MIVRGLGFIPLDHAFECRQTTENKINNACYVNILFRALIAIEIFQMTLLFFHIYLIRLFPYLDLLIQSRDGTIGTSSYEIGKSGGADKT